MKKHLLPKEGSLYKANLHMHTTVSDGKMTPEETKEHYMKNGYSVVAFTDHDIMVCHNDLTDENFVAINSMETFYNTEYFSACFDPAYKNVNHPYAFVDTYHLNFYAKTPNITRCPAFSRKFLLRDNSWACLTDDMLVDELDREYSVDCINDIIKKANEAGFLVSYNHPVWSGQTYEQYGELQGVWGVEVYNSGANLAGHIEDDHAFEDMLRQGKWVFPLAVDDAHRYEHACHGWVMLKAERLTYENVICALEKGDFYASTGPEIYELSVEDDTLYVRCSPAVRIIVSTERRTIFQKENQDNVFEEASFDLAAYKNDCKEMSQRMGLPRKPFIRVRVYDNKGGIAYTRAYTLEEL